MPKRKAAQPNEDDSDLSPPPNGFLDGEQVMAGAHEHDGEEPPAKKRKGRQAKPSTAEQEVDEPNVNGAEALVKPAKKRVTKRTVKGEAVEEDQVEEQVESGEATPKKKRSRKKEVKEGEAGYDANGEVVKKEVKTKRKSKAEKERELVEMPLATRTAGHRLLIGAHVSAAGGVHQAVLNSVHIGANAFALFLKSQRKWENPPLLDDHCATWHAHCKTHTYDQTNHIVPHGSYLVNLAHTDKARTTQAYASFLEDLRRCERLGITLYNFHPGTNQCGDKQKALSHLAANINRAHAETQKVVLLLETMATGGTTIGSTFEDLHEIISQVADKERVGVCMDTAHVFAAGYDLRTPTVFKQTMEHFEETVGFKYLRAMHLNDSKAPFASQKDLHANIGTGFLGLRAFHNLVNEPRIAGLPLVLETPIEVRDDEGNLVKDEKGKEREDKGIWAREIKLLESLVGMDVESEEFREMEKKLAKRGEPERKRLLEMVERKREKDGKKAKGGGRTKKGKKDDSVSSGGSSPLSEAGDDT